MSKPELLLHFPKEDPVIELNTAAEELCVESKSLYRRCRRLDESGSLRGGLVYGKRVVPVIKGIRRSALEELKRRDGVAT